ncbi:MAG: arylsulfatase [Cyclobacteriaceae bacterium]
MTLLKKYTTFYSCILLTGLVSCNQEIKSDQQPVQPNVIYILADDLGYGDLSCYGQARFQTPNIDRLAAEGMLFTQHYSGATVCAPSRSALMTGMHTGHTPVRGNYEIDPEGQYPLPDTMSTLPKLLKSQGYTTGIFGKWGLGFPGSSGDPMNQGFDRFYGYNCQRLAHHYYPRYLWDNDQIDSIPQNAGQNKDVYAPDRIHERAMTFIEENQEGPFFLYYAAVAPHAELTAPESYMEKFRGKYEPELDYKGHDEGEGYREGRYESQPESHAAFVAMITHLDDRVGQIVSKIDELGLSENTLIVFTSDNGPHQEGGADPDFFNSNGELKGYKRDLYEGGVRVPMIAKWPGQIKKGVTTDHVSAFWDVMPTVAELIGAESNQTTDGISFAPTLMSTTGQQQHDYLYWEFHERGGRRAVRKDNWKLVQYGVNKRQKGEYELYDLNVDLGEETNVATHHPQLVIELTEIMENARVPSSVFKFKNETLLADE